MGRKILVIWAVIMIFFFMTISSSSTNTESGFGKIKPMEPSIELSSDGVLSASFMNGVGMDIVLERFDVSFRGTKCKVTFPGKDNGLPLPISAGEVFRMEAQCPNVTLNSCKLGFPIEVEYIVIVAGNEITHTETASIIQLNEVECEKEKSKKQFKDQVYSIVSIVFLSLFFLLIIRKYRKRKKFSFKEELKELIKPTSVKLLVLFFLVLPFITLAWLSGKMNVIFDPYLLAASLQIRKDTASFSSQRNCDQSCR